MKTGATTGFPIGEKSRIHAELTLGVAFDSNVSRLDPDLAGDRDPDGRMLIRPGVSVDVPGCSIRLGLGAHASVNYFFKVGNASNKHGPTNVGADATLDFGLGSKSSVVGFTLSGHLIRHAHVYSSRSGPSPPTRSASSSGRTGAPPA